MSTTVNKLQKSATKQQEISHLLEFAKALPDDCYLSSLFTQDMLAWVEQRIRNDFTVDLFDEMKASQIEVRAAVKHTNEFEEDAARLTKEVTRLTGELKAANDLFTKEVANHNRNLFEAEQKAADERRDCNDAVQQLQDANDAAKLEIIRLKAEIYDLTNKG